MKTAEVADLARVHPETVRRWVVDAGLRATRTPGGHLRFPRSIVLELLARAAR